jgi:hypothetical protein
MNGNVVHAWHDARVTGRARLLTDGNLLVIATDNSLREYDWQGNLLWEYAPRSESLFPHHDVIRLANGNTLSIYGDVAEDADRLLEVNAKGETVWAWRSVDHMQRYLQSVGTPHDRTHFNSVQELPQNRWFRRGDTRFRPGNLLVSSRSLNIVFVIDKDRGDIVWEFGDQLDGQHEALMIEDGQPGAGNVLLFNNGYRNLHDYRRSTILEIDPSTGSAVWEYQHDYFYSPVGGIQQGLPNGNVLITSSHGGRVFEVDRDGKLVWEWVPPYCPLRPARYPPDYCPQFEALTAYPHEPVSAEPDSPFVDRGLWVFAFRPHVVRREIHGARRTVLKKERGCRVLVVPGDGRLHVAYGLDDPRLSEAGRTDVTIQFKVVMSVLGSADSLVLISDAVGSHDEATWRERVLPMSEYAYQSVSVCLEAESSPAPGRRADAARFALWENPRIVPRRWHQRPARRPRDEATRRERDIAQRRLKALGYID